MHFESGLNKFHYGHKTASFTCPTIKAMQYIFLMDQQNHKACTRSSPQLMVENLGKWRERPQQITRLVQDGPPQLMVKNPGKWREGPPQITRLAQDGPPQLMVENPGKWREGPHWFLRTTNKMAPLGATKY